MGHRWGLAFLLVAVGCSVESEPEVPLSSDCIPPNRIVADRCLEPGVQDDGCPAGTLGLDDGSCQPAGVPPEMCGEGFEPNGDMGCEPILPPETCPPGQMAVPGESACHPVMPCGAGQWGDIPVDATTVYVDAGYAGLDSDGSSAKPFTTISDAVLAAASGALIAVAAGNYLEDVIIQDKAVRLWGKCPSEVELRGSDAGWAALFVRGGASGSEVHGLALGGATTGLAIADCDAVLVDRVWVHDALAYGVAMQNNLGSTPITVHTSLVEDNYALGVVVSGSDATLDGLVVRRTLPDASGYGWGILSMPNCTPAGCDRAARSAVNVRGSLVEENHRFGVIALGSDATLDGLMVRRTLPDASDQAPGFGIAIQDSCIEGDCDAPARSTALVRGSVIEDSPDVGVFVAASDATLEGLVVRGTLPLAGDELAGRGIQIQLGCTAAACDPAKRATAFVRNSVVDESHDVGVRVGGSDATFEGVLIRSTLPQASDQHFGRGLQIQLACSDAGCDPQTRSTALVRGSLVEANYDVGVFVGSSDATLEGLLVRATVARQADGLFGDGVAVYSYLAPANATVTATRVETSARAGLSNFGATVALGASALSCNAVDLEGEKYRDLPHTFEDLGNNACGCPAPVAGCKAQSVGLEPPEPFSQ